MPLKVDPKDYELFRENKQRKTAIDKENPSDLKLLKFVLCSKLLENKVERFFNWQTSLISIEFLRTFQWSPVCSGVYGVRLKEIQAAFIKDEQMS